LLRNPSGCKKDVNLGILKRIQKLLGILGGCKKDMFCELCKKVGKCSGDKKM